MSLIGQGIVASRVSLASISRRLGLAFVIVVCMACVIGVSLSMFSLTEGLARAFAVGGDDKHAIVTGSDRGGIDRASAATVLEAPGIASGPDGKPLASVEAIQYLPPPPGFSEGTLFIRGVAPNWRAVTSGFRIVSGRMFRSGKQELIVGRGAESMFGLKEGTSVILPNGEWPIVGEFTANGSYVESELLGDAETVMTVGRISKYATVVMALEGPSAFVRLKSWLTSNPSLSVSAERQSDFLARTAGRYTKFFTTIAYLVACMMGIGAICGSVQIMYASVEARTREIGILRAIGYGPGGLALTVLLEIVVLSLIGALVGTTLAVFLFDQMQAISGDTVFRLHVSGGMIAAGFAAAALLALAGGIFPAIRAARLPVAQAVRA